MISANGPWPPPSEFNRMLQNPRIAFKPRDLQNCTIECDVNGQPTVRSGAFATVYKGTYPWGENVCLRVFTSRAEDRRERYAAISDYVRSRKLRFLVNFVYHESAIRHPTGKWYPLVTMEWVEGNVLFDWLRERCLHNDMPALGRVAEQWVELVGELEAARIAHGDLQHNNVMVTAAGELKLVDYDGMCVPAIEGRINLEFGVEPYQHPQRGPDTKLFADLDNFSALFIYVALRALAAEPQLWSRYIEPPNGEPYDKLLFRKSDFEAPQHSALIKDLRRSPDAQVQRLTEELIGLRQIPLQNVPRLSHFANDFDAIRKLFQQRDWDAAVELLDRNSQSKLPGDITASARDARVRVKCREELTVAVDNGDEQAMQRLHNSSLMKNYPKAQPLLDIARLAPKVIPVLKELDEARQAQGWRKLVSIWEAHEALLRNRQSAQCFREEIEPARQRNRACDDVLHLLGDPQSDADQLETAWNKLQELGGHPEADRYSEEVSRSVRRKRAFDKFRRIPDVLRESVDRKLASVWNESEFQGLAGADAERQRYVNARSRLKLVKALRDVVQQAGSKASVAGERKIHDASSRLPAGYAIEGDLLARAQLATQRLNACRTCRTAMDRENPDEKSLASAWTTLVSVKGEEMLDARRRTRMELAVRRRPLLEKLAAIPLLENANSTQDHELIKTWNETLLSDCSEAQLWKPAYEAAVVRRTKLAELRQLIDTDDDFAIADCLETPCFEKYEFSPDLKERLIKTRKRVQEVKGLINALHTGQKSRFVELFDQDVVRRFAARFVPYQARLTNWITTEILPREKIGLNEPQLEKSMTASPGRLGRWQFRWTWPPRRFTSHCLLGFCRKLPSGITNPRDVVGHCIPIERRQWESAGAYYDIKPESEWGNYVAVWAEVDLGFEKLLSEPLVLGRL
jgi:hypothetical protein